MKTDLEHDSQSAPVKRIAWVVSTLMQVGGGERLIFEVREALERAGVEVTLITWHLDPIAFFEGRYSSDNIIILGHEDGALVQASLFERARRRVTTLFALRKEFKRLNPDVIVCQSEYDVVMVFLATLFSPFRYVAKIFGQTFLNVDDVAKYTLIFRKHLEKIRTSTPGYLATVPAHAPKVGVINRLASEVISVLRFIAIRHARVRFVLAPQSRWEAQLMYGCDSVVLRSGFPRRWLTYTPSGAITKKWGLTGKRIILCFSRLVVKKRVDLAIRAFAEMSQAVPGAHLLIGGRGSEEQNLRALAKQLGVGDRVTFAGFVPESELMDYFGESHAVINLDIAQFDIVGNEAIGARKHIVCVVENEFDEVFKHAGMIHAAEANPRALAAALQKALVAPPVELTPELLSALEERTWDAYADTMLKQLKADRSKGKGTAQVSLTKAAHG